MCIEHPSHAPASHLPAPDVFGAAAKNAELSALADPAVGPVGRREYDPSAASTRSQRKQAAEHRAERARREAAMTPEQKATRRDYYRARRSAAKAAPEATRFYKF